MQNTEYDISKVAASGENVWKRSTVHGGNIYEAARQFGLDTRKITDFSSNVNPLGPSALAERAAKRALSIVDSYPDPEMADLRRVISQYFGIKPEQVMCGNGSSSLIYLIPRVFRTKKALIPIPTFSEYAHAVEQAGAEVVPFPLRERDGFRMDPVEMAFALKDVDMAFLCNPNNPTGQFTPKAEVLEIMQFSLQHRVRLVVDEAFMDFIDSESIIKEVVQSTNIICLRTFTNFFAMPGLRIGYAVSDEATIADIRHGQEPWAVSIPAEQAAIAALDDWGYIKKTRRFIEKERNRMLAALRLLPGVETFSGAANFILVKLVSADTHTIREKLGLHGMLVRDCTSFPGLDSRFIRITVRKRRENERLLQALREMLLK